MSNAITGAITVVLADDHQLLREGLVRLLSAEVDLEVVDQASNGYEVLEALRRHAVDVLVTDLSMPGIPTMDLIKRVKAEFPEVAVLVLTMHAEEQYALRAFRSGANGYLTKDVAGEQLVGAIRKVASGGAYVSPGLAEKLAIGLREFQGAPRHEQLSNREFEVYRLIVGGRRLTDIADELHAQGAHHGTARRRQHRFAGALRHGAPAVRGARSAWPRGPACLRRTRD